VKVQKEVRQEEEEEMLGKGFDFVLDLIRNHHHLNPKGLFRCGQPCQPPTRYLDAWAADRRAARSAFGFWKS
jgi:hypothetical protein